MLFSDKIGSYLVDSASFMKSCYSYQTDVGLQEDNPLIKKTVKEIKDSFSMQIDSMLKMSKLEPIEGKEIEFDTNYTYFGTSGFQTLVATKEKTKDTVIQLLFGNQEDVEIETSFSPKPEISVELRPTNVKERADGHTRLLKVVYTLIPGENGIAIHRDVRGHL
mgnify:CR=1 FL=1